MGSADSDAVYPACLGVLRTVEIGGETREELLGRLAEKGVEMNEAGRVLMGSERFLTSAVRRRLNTVELSVRELGFPQGATMPELYAGAQGLGLGLCPVEAGPHLRLQLLDQPEGFCGQEVRPHRAPPGAIIVASELLSEEDDFPKGFYLRRINGTLWLRGYWCGLDHVCGAEERFVFELP